MQTSKIQSEFKQKLKEAKLKATSTRLEIYDILSEARYPMTIQEIVANATTSHFVSIYRSVDAMHKAGIVKQVPRGFKNCFELSEDFKPHHHHITCEVCNISVDIENKSIERMMSQITKDAGLMPTRHHFELLGICKVCQVKAARQS